MRTTTVRSAEWYRAIWLPLVLQLLCLAGSASGQAAPPTYGEARPVFIALIARVDPLDPSRYLEVPTNEQSGAVAFFRGNQRVPFSVPQVLERDDELETARDVMAVIRYPIGDVYVDAGTHVRIGSLDVLFGRVFAKVKGFFSVENQNVVAGVEGTEFAFEVARDGSTEITVLDGAVLSSSKRLPWKPLRVTRNQAFWVTNAGMQIRVGAAPPTELAQLQRWVDRADRAVAVLAPREPQAPPPPIAPAPPPEPQPQQPVPPSMQPVPRPLQPAPPPVQSTTPPVIVLPVPIITDPSGYCCDTNGQVYPSAGGACRGRLYQYRADALAQCRDRRGFCCANNRVFETIPSQCTGIFSYNQASVRESCAPPTGWCCADGRVSQTRQDRCGGTFTLSQSEALKACRVVILTPNTDTGQTGKPSSDAAKTKVDTTKVSPKTKVESTKVQKQPASDNAKSKESSTVIKQPASGAKAKAETSQILKPPPPDKVN
jgi:hypothetical protein